MFSSGDATSMINDTIDTPFSGTDFFDALLENEEYLERYHAYLQQLVDEYVNGGRFDEVYGRIRSQIDALVGEDPNASYTYEEYETAAGILYEVVNLRAESISGQLDGTIPSTDAGQKQDSSSLVDASHIDVEAMGQFDMGGGGGGFVGFGRANRRSNEADGETSSADSAAPSEDGAQTMPENGGQNSGGFDPGSLPGGFGGEGMPDMGSFGSGEMPDMGSFSPGSMPDTGSFGSGGMPDMGSFGSGERPDAGSFSPGGQNGSGQNGAAASEPDTDTDAADSGTPPSGSGRERPSSSSFSGMPGQSSAGKGIGNLLLYGICLAVAVAALAAVTVFARRKRH